ncbi:hypothetical protein NEUTE2DRAFT_170690 [Neurospora tetrasperma FGSC 2509]|nr:hypothetical protein NEUTE2DRAFT_170690 [Neurospora tetrasperma FGSC 2509]
MIVSRLCSGGSKQCRTAWRQLACKGSCRPANEAHCPTDHGQNLTRICGLLQAYVQGRRLCVPALEEWEQHGGVAAEAACS